eukprot:CAMPEP_0204261044 /NCGR_PEP_ID=MMETSP0468-20130131/6734_1 /ASSEMBLY_ACC=CAM_ASM_000383 /TAXON_ID=2969 /ORGANISM="Oxyrrhis marina" /LENGTH=164 /DNA_ID=CAMNT_0051235545 /DNA_START=152 /DNA_END=642 /DNA_ORIENTATION=+
MSLIQSSKASSKGLVAVGALLAVVLLDHQVGVLIDDSPTDPVSKSGVATEQFADKVEFGTLANELATFALLALVVVCVAACDVAAVQGGGEAPDPQGQKYCLRCQNPQPAMHSMESGSVQSPSSPMQIWPFLRAVWFLMPQGHGVPCAADCRGVGALPHSIVAK